MALLSIRCGVNIVIRNKIWRESSKLRNIERCCIYYNTKYLYFRYRKRAFLFTSIFFIVNLFLQKQMQFLVVEYKHATMSQTVNEKWGNAQTEIARMCRKIIYKSLKSGNGVERSKERRIDIGHEGDQVPKKVVRLFFSLSFISTQNYSDSIS
jgi:hypothetical protein